MTAPMIAGRTGTCPKPMTAPGMRKTDPKTLRIGYQYSGGQKKPVAADSRGKVFICSPYRPVGDSKAQREKSLKENMELARQACRYAVNQGYIPIAPHLYFPQFLDDQDPEERKRGIELGLQLLSECQELWIIGTRISSGMEYEIARARKQGIRIRRMIPDDSIDEWLLNLMLTGLRPTEDVQAFWDDQEDWQ